VSKRKDLSGFLALGLVHCHEAWFHNDLKGFEMLLQSIEAAASHAIHLIINNLARHTHTGIDSGTISKPFKSFQKPYYPQSNGKSVI
jgi:hypothetical protein